MKHAVVTGATGYVGSNLCKYLLENNWTVSIIVRPTSKYTNLHDITDKITIFKYNDDLDQLILFFSNNPPDVVFHLASQVLVEHKPEDIDGLAKSNIQFGLHILEAMKNTRTKLLINTGTSWQNYHSDYYKPVNLYAATKEAFEALIQYYVSANYIRAITLKLFDTYGENDTRPKLINLLNTFSDNNELLNVSPGHQFIDLVHIDDVVRAYEAAYDYLLVHPVDYDTFGVGSENPIKLRELIATFERLTKKKLNIVWGGRAYREREVMKPWQSYKKLPNWKATISIEEGLLRYKQ